ncbi:LysR family transcriptional regulator [Hydrogenophaga sp. PBL-H3]|uniref:LysR family transcriptional regulator n=1 Tax=Hydrogenophaga sp. PBL-H3 TaxID=434010 RepID=UPI0013201961|nr:LysR family transcriptional regulator [Hydrogenophaga sp. PBL-H3]QHE78668.1 LysR family transcriptional regulator [Hydrogenophaga sp. PBL-H3]QHE83093.1 LysR family transcriptional regulator [Hydrogenophaga sp. PBL-H3]
MIDKSNQPSFQRLRLNLRQLEVFLATARGGSTRAAADRIARSQSAASTSLADLEAALGVELFDRIGRRLQLNENGRALLPKAQVVVDQATELQALFMDEHAAPLRVAASFTIGEYLLPGLVSRWTQLHPKSKIHLRIGNTSDVIEAVAALDVDIGFVEGSQTHADLVVQPWRDDEMVILAAPGHPLANRCATPHQLAQATWVVREHGSGTRQITDEWLLKNLEQVRIGFELGSNEAIKRVVAAGDGLGCLSRYAVEQSVADGHLIELQTRLPKASRKLAIVLHREKKLGRATKDFLAHCSAAGQRSAS